MTEFVKFLTDNCLKGVHVVEPVREEVFEKSMFYHVRNYYCNTNGEKVKTPRGGLTLCSLSLQNSPAIKIMTWGVSKCHENDTYNKRLGRVKAEGRAKSKKYSFFTPELCPDIAKKFVDILAEKISECKISIPDQDLVNACVMLARSEAVYTGEGKVLEISNGI